MAIHDWASRLWLVLIHDWGWLWLFVAGVIAGLGIGMAYATIRYAGRSRRLEQLSQQATRQVYREVDAPMPKK